MQANKLFDKNKILVLDGGMGTMLQKKGVSIGEVPETLNITDGDTISEIHAEYIAAGSDIIYTNTFGASRYKSEGCGYSVEELVKAAIAAARKAARSNAMVALDIGPLGRMLEPAGDVSFEDAYEAFKEIVIAGRDEDVDLIVIETMTDLYETKAAILAAKENSQLPVIASMSFEADGRTFTGTSIEAMATCLEGLGIDAMGINCSLGPAEILPLAKRLVAASDIPVFFKPNAGLPDPETGAYDITALEFAEHIKKYMELGISLIGGCCGTDPDFIRGIRQVVDAASGGKIEKNEERKNTTICSSSKIVTFDHIVVCGERLNPTGKKRLKQALLDGDMAYVMKQAIAQDDEGAELLDVNVGVPGIDEVAVLPEVVKKIQTVTNLPLQIDSSNPQAIEAALRVYNGKAIINSVNGEEKSLNAILPIAKKYGASVIALTLDEDGIPETTEKRVEIAKKIITRAGEIGIPARDVIVDCLTLTASAQQEGVVQTLDAITRIKKECGNKTALGVSNISFGLPARPLVNKTFLIMAIQSGLDMPIIDPGNEEMMAAVATAELLHGRDKNGERFIEKYQNYGITGSVNAKQEDNINDARSLDNDNSSGKGDIFYAIEKGLEDETSAITKELLNEYDEMTIVSDHLVPALDKIGKGFEDGKIFLPQMIQAATAAQSGFEVIKQSMLSKGQKSVSLGKVIIATVKGDVHDIGKNIVRVIMENYGFNVIDLGKDVDPETIVARAKEENCHVIGLSALMTTTLGSMEETIRLVKEKDQDAKVLVGGAVLTEEYAEKINADYYCKDAMRAVDAAKDSFAQI